jgi:putative acetyltransferase
MDEIVVERGDPRSEPAAALIEELDGYLRSLYPPASNHLLDLDSLSLPEVRFFLARVRELVAGCAALRLDPEGYGELKRMFVRVPARGHGVAIRLLERIEAEARAEGLTHLLLETGVSQPEALAFYRRAGFVERGPFGPYGPDPLSIFMEKRLLAPAHAG